MAKHSFYISPVVTEKTTLLANQNKYVFYISSDANKIELKQFFRNRFDVDPLSINVLNLKGKKVRRGRIEGKRKDRKKIIVTLKDGQTIDLGKQR